MPKKPRISQEDIDAFQQAVKGTKRLTKKRVRLAPPLSPPHSRPQLPEETLPFSEAQDLSPVSGEEYMAYKQTDVSMKTLKQLRHGDFAIDAILDLHGMTIEKARLSLSTFLQTCLHEQRHVVLIIHGKGRPGQLPVLKNKLNHWLRDLDSVLAFTSAASAHGSRGAVYVMLRVLNIPNHLSP